MKKRLWIWLMLLALAVVLVLSAPYISDAALRAVNRQPWVKAEGAQVTPFGIRLIGVEVAAADAGVSGRFEHAYIGWLSALGLRRALNVAGGGVSVGDIRRLLQAPAKGFPDVRLSVSNVNAAVEAWGRHVVLQGLSGDIQLKGGALASAKVRAEWLLGSRGPLVLSYERGVTNRLALDVDLAALAPLLASGGTGGPSQFAGRIGFSGSFDPVALSGRARLAAKDLALTNTRARLAAAALEADAFFEAGGAGLEARIYAGRLEAGEARHDFSQRPATVSFKARDTADAVVLDELRVTAPGWLQMKLTGRIGKNGATDMTVHLRDVPLAPLVTTGWMRLGSSGRSERMYRLSGNWPALTAAVTSSVEGLSLEIPHLDLEVSDISAGPLEGDWRLEKLE